MYTRIKYLATVSNNIGGGYKTAYFLCRRNGYVLPVRFCGRKTSNRPFEIYDKTCKAFGIKTKRIIVFNFLNGNYYAYVSQDNGNVSYEIYTQFEYAFYLIESTLCPVYIKNELLFRMGIKINKEIIARALRQ